MKSDLKSAMPTIFGRRVPKNGILSSTNSTVFRRCPKEHPKCFIRCHCLLLFPSMHSSLSSHYMPRKFQQLLSNFWPQLSFSSYRLQNFFICNVRCPYVILDLLKSLSLVLIRRRVSCTIRIEKLERLVASPI